MDRKETAIKTLKGWEKSGKNLMEYLNVGDEVDEDMVDYFTDILPPHTLRRDMLQVGEPYDSVPITEDPFGPCKTTWSTFQMIGGKWFWKGHCFAGETEEPKRV